LGLVIFFFSFFLVKSKTHHKKQPATLGRHRRSIGTTSGWFNN
jgi:hypothetical protein